MLNADITSDNYIFTPLKNFPETFSEEERYIYLYCLHIHAFMHAIPNGQICIEHLTLWEVGHKMSTRGPYLIFGSSRKGAYIKNSKRGGQDAFSSLASLSYAN